MIEYKIGVDARVPVRLLDVVGTPVTGQAFGAMTAWISKSSGATANVSPADGAHWVETTAGSFLNQGNYDLIIPAASINVSGLLKYAVSNAGAVTFHGIVKVVSNEEVDTYTRLGAPAGASTAADIAAVKADSASLISSMVRALGLMHENSVLDTTTYNANNNLLTGRLRIYDTKAHAQAATGTGLLNTYTITATYTGLSLTTYTVVKEP